MSFDVVVTSIRNIGLKKIFQKITHDHQIIWYCHVLTIKIYELLNKTI